MRGSLDTSEADAIFEVTGVPASEILRRCAALRAARTSGDPTLWAGWPFAANAQRPTWRLLDFADGPEEEFVRAAYASLLCRDPSDAESTLRIAALRAGYSRFQVVVRLALSSEGRHARDQPVSGIALPALVVAGRAIERVVRVPVLGPALRRAKLKVSQTSHTNRAVSRKRAS